MVGGVCSRKAPQGPVQLLIFTYCLPGVLLFHAHWDESRTKILSSLLLLTVVNPQVCFYNKADIKT